MSGEGGLVILGLAARVASEGVEGSSQTVLLARRKVSERSTHASLLLPEQRGDGG